MDGHHGSRFSTRAAIGVVMGLACANCEPARVIRVTSSDDGGGGSLRAAISKANRGRPARVRIEVPSGTYVLSRCGADDTNDSGDLDLTTSADVEISGTGADVTIRQSCSGERILDARGPRSLRLSNLTLTGGSAVERGGAIQAGVASLNRVTLTNNRAGTEGGGIYATTLTVDDSSFSANRAATGGAIFAAEGADIRRSKLDGNGATLGRALASMGLVKLTDTALMNNATAARFVHPLGLPFTLEGSGAVIVADVLNANRVTIASTVTTPRNQMELCGYNSNDPMIQVYSTVVSKGVEARVVSMVNTTYFDNYGPPPLATIPCKLHGGGVHASESVSMNHVTFSGSVTTPELRADRSLLCGATPNVAGSAHNWNSCEFTYPPGYIFNVLGMTGLLGDNGGAVPTIAPLFSSPLVDKIPSSECPERVDARGMARPQGDNCDIGAVELQYPEGAGKNALRLELVHSGAVTAGKDYDVKLLVHNAGPGGAVATISMKSDVVSLYAGPASHGGICSSNPASCTIPLLPAGETAEIPLQWQFSSYLSQVDVDASVTAGLGRQPPFEDDSLSATLPVRVDAALRLEVRGAGRELRFVAPNLGPYVALSSAERPMMLSFQAAAGVRSVFNEASAGDDAFWPEDPYPLELAPVLSFDGVPPAVLGTVRLDPGPNSVSGAAEVTVPWIPGSDLRIRAARQAGRYAEGEALPVRVSLENLGPMPVRGGYVHLENCCPTDPVTWSPTVGSITTDDNRNPIWTIPDLAPGESAVLDGIARVRPFGQILPVSAASSNEEDARDNGVPLDLSPSLAGTADLRITQMILRPGAVSGEYVADVTLINGGEERFEDVVTLEGRWYPLSDDVSLTAAVLEGNFSCSEETCSSTTALEVNEGASIRFTIRGRPARFTLSLRGLGAVVDPDYGNNERTVW